MFGGSTSTVISLFNGAVDTSSVMLLFCKVIGRLLVLSECSNYKKSSLF